MKSPTVSRPIAICLLVFSIGVALALLFFTRRGQMIMHDPREAGRDFAGWTKAHPIHALLIFFALYLLLTLLLLPVWTVQVLSGFLLSRSLGIYWGILLAMILCQIAATTAAIVSFYFSRWLAADWFHNKVEGKMQTLRRLDENLGHNGFLVVMAVRLMHVLPFALSNYMFGLLRITVADILIGTLLGGIPGVLLYVTVGAHPQLLREWKFTTAMVIINIILILPIAMRYLKPQWFKKIGVE